MKYRYEKIHENGDATSSYNLAGQFPVPFKDFFKWVLENDDSFSIEFGASNECFGGWLGNRLEVHKDRIKCIFTKKDPENWLDEIANLNITSVWANGGWGQMLYICTFDIAEQKNADNQEYKKGYQDGSKEAVENLIERLKMNCFVMGDEEFVYLSDIINLAEELGCKNNGNG